jgi:tetratricopeptide (TPR) repeat protein
VWQALYEDLGPRGLEIVTVALDTGGEEAARPWIEAARPTHPSLIDRAHVVDELFGIVNVPSGVWIDEEGRIVRPPETAYPRRPDFQERAIPPGATPDQVATVLEVRKLRTDAEGYVAALRDWVALGARSRFVLSPEEVSARSNPRREDEARAAAHFELGQHLHRLGRPDWAIPHFREAYRLHPDNWTYKRQAWALLDPDQTPLAVYGGDWLTDVRKIGGENYYPPLDL